MDLSELEEITCKVICHERSGPVERTVRPLIFTPENIKRYWDLVRLHKVLFWKEVRDDMDEFINYLFSTGPDGQPIPNGLYWVIDDFVGLMYITEIVPETNALCHFVFFDAQFAGRDKLIHTMLHHLFNDYKFHRLSVEIAQYANPKVFTFVETLGFKHEGRRRSFIKRDDEWYDLKLYYLLKDRYLSAS